MFKTDVAIHHIFTSPGHHYFTRKKYDVGVAPTIQHQEISLQSDLGLPNDRFENSKYPITFFSLEVANEVCKNMDIDLDIKLFRRNIIISGIHLNSLIKQRFKIGDIEFEGIEHCSPCTWMNAVMKKGVYTQMIGRGGLRARVISPGKLSLGQHKLIHDIEINKNPIKALKRPKIPTN